MFVVVGACSVGEFGIVFVVFVVVLVGLCWLLVFRCWNGYCCCFCCCFVFGVVAVVAVVVVCVGGVVGGVVAEFVVVFDVIVVDCVDRCELLNGDFFLGIECCGGCSVEVVVEGSNVPAELTALCTKCQS